MKRTVDLGKESIFLLNQYDVNLLVALLGETKIKDGEATLLKIRDGVSNQDDIQHAVLHEMLKSRHEPEPADPTQPAYHEVD